jgi:hypothetical protein
MKEVTRKLEVTLVPDTGDLSVRIGLHSGYEEKSCVFNSSVTRLTQLLGWRVLAEEI